MSYRHLHGRFRGHDGAALYFQFWLAPDAPPERTIVFHHGLGEHAGRYGNVLDAFAGQGVNLCSFDARGHGRSAGRRGDAPSVEALVLDLECYLEFLEAELEVEYPVLLGHSMGGLIALSFALRFANQWSLRAIVTSGAALRPSLGLPQRIKAAAGRALLPFAPGLVLDTGLPASGLSHDERVIREYERDPLVHGKASVRLALGLLDAGERTLELAPRLKIPCLITHGEDDPIADAAGSVEMYQMCSSNDRSLEIYPGLYHEIYNESEAERERVLEDLRRWVLDRMAPPAADDAEAAGNSAAAAASPASAEARSD